MTTYHNVPPATHEELACYCCGKSLNPSDLVRFERHSYDGVCIGCAAWLHERSLSVGRETLPRGGARSGELQSCSFCDKQQKQVNTLIAGPAVFICDGCVDRARTVLARAGQTSSTPTATIRQVSDESPEEECHFCGKRRHQVQAMAAADTRRICNECLDLCDEIISDNRG